MFLCKYFKDLVNKEIFAIYLYFRFLKFSDSVYKTPSIIEYWEKQNLHGSMILMEGSKTGSAKVTVKPLDSAYKVILNYFQ